MNEPFDKNRRWNYPDAQLNNKYDSIRRLIDQRCDLILLIALCRVN